MSRTGEGSSSNDGSFDGSSGGSDKTLQNEGKVLFYLYALSYSEGACTLGRTKHYLSWDNLTPDGEGVYFSNDKGFATASDYDFIHRIDTVTLYDGKDYATYLTVISDVSKVRSEIVKAYKSFVTKVTKELITARQVAIKSVSVDLDEDEWGKLEAKDDLGICREEFEQYAKTFLKQFVLQYVAACAAYAVEPALKIIEALSDEKDKTTDKTDMLIKMITGGK